ncbi:MAG TPA: helix-turn-helix domain-containing protein [Thermoanaerobaculia bacterium]|nr:helix-turn-helix domain-containing protein [Thermoanaerobaculia bacterium]
MPRTTPPLLAAVLRHLREESGWTQSQLEARAELGPGVVSKLERGAQCLGRIEVERLARVMGFDGGWIDRTLAAVEQLPRKAAPGGSPAALTVPESRAVEALAAGLSRQVAAAVREQFGGVLVARRWQSEREAAGEGWKQLRRLPAEDRLVLVTSVEDFQTWALCERLCEESYRIVSRDAEDSRRLAQLALSAAERAPGDPAWRGCLEGYALSFVGNAWRVLGDFPRANRTLRQSAARIAEATVEAMLPLDATRPLLLHAVLFKYQEEFDESLRVTERALTLRPGALQTARLLINKASVLEKKQALEEALTTLDIALPSAREAGDARLLWAIEFNRTSYLCRLERFDEAIGRIDRLRAAAFEAGRTLDLLRLSWLDARIAEGSHRSREAAHILDSVWKAFAEQKMPFDAAIAALELAALELERGNTREVKSLASAAAPVFAALTLPEKLLASTTLFWQGARKEAAAVTAARRLLTDLTHFRHEPFAV